MNEQEMQFADPDWQPSNQASVSQESGAASISEQPVRSNHIVNQHSSASSYTPYEQGYNARRDMPSGIILPAAVQRPDQPLRVSHRRSLWWLWVLLFILIPMLFGGIVHPFGRGGDHRPAFLSPGQIPSSFTLYDLKGDAHITINDPSHSITVQVVSGNTGQIGVQTDDGFQTGIEYNADTLAVTDNTSNITVIVPQHIALQLNTKSGEIDVSGYTGQLAAQSDSGAITLRDDALTDQSTVSSNSGDITLNQAVLVGQVAITTGGSGSITFNGLLDPQGQYQFTTERGSINLSLPQGIAMQVQDSVGSGSYQSDFSNPTGDIPQATVTVQTKSGAVRIHQQS